MRLIWLVTASLLSAPPAFAQSGHDQHLDAPAPPIEAPSTPTPNSDPHAGHHGSHTPAKVPPPPAAVDPHAGHNMGAAAAGNDEVGNAPAPAPPSDHAADAIFGVETMAQSRRELAHEVGGMGYSLAMVDLLEVGFRKGRESYRFEGEMFTGGNIDRYGLKFEGEGAFGGKLGDLEVQALYSKAIAPYWNLQAGVRHDFKPDPSRTHLVLGLEGMAPYWIKANAAAFLSTNGEVRFRVEASYDQRLTQELILQPRLEANFSLQDVPALGIGSGLSDFEAGLRLRYEVEQEVAPYLGLEWRKKSGETARFDRLAGDDPDSVNLVAGIRIWF